MCNKYFRLFSLIFVLLLQLPLVSCGGGFNTNNFPVVVFSDVHFNPFDDTSLFTSLVLTDASGWEGVFQQSYKMTPSTYGYDTNYPLLMIALSSIRQNLGASPLVVYTGDILGHNFSEQFYALYYGSLGVPVPPPADIAKDPAAVAAMEAFANKTVAFFMDQVRSSVGNIPVMFTVGNSDSYLGIVPEPSFLANTAELYHTKFLNSSTDHQAFLDSFKKGGYYSMEPPGTNLMVIGINTVLCAFPDNTTTARFDEELHWLDTTLTAAKAADKKVWLLMHIPPGADIDSTAVKADNGQIDIMKNAVMMWQPPPTYTYQADFLTILANHPGVVTLTLAAHTHMDEFRIMSPDNVTPADVLEITPAITPIFGNNPAFKVFAFSRDTLKPIDYRSLNYDLATMPRRFHSYYTFSSAYCLSGYLNDSLAQLYPALKTNTVQQKLYQKHYYSGNTPQPPLSAQHVPITPANWPIFWSGIGNMDQQDFFNSVNSY